MGCCISTCKPKKDFTEECNCVEDKLVVSQNQPPTSNKISPYPYPYPSSPPSTASSSLISRTTNSSLCSSVSASSSILVSKDRSFSNEFLWSCAKENPHILRINSIKKNSVSLNKHDSQKLKNSLRNQTIPERGVQKRARSPSPSNLSRQKSFRKETERVAPPSSSSSSSSLAMFPSKRFPSHSINGDNNKRYTKTTQKSNCSSRMVGRINKNSANSTPRRENLRSSSPIQSSYRHGSPFRNRETCIHRISSKIDQVAVGQALSHLDNDSLSAEDIDNPLISLDCFIFV